ncbi:MAG TPA: GNAT family N-acetyltransferase [Clostridia bacterium]|nr:GNAT family N-acetyltransferase [Clostridia bacterium]
MLKHKGTVPLESERLELRRFTLNDAEAMFKNWTSDEEVARYMRWNAHKSIDETKNVLIKRIEKYNNLGTYHWAIVLKGTDMPVGNIVLMTSNEYDRCAEVAYCLGKQYWGRGIITEALITVLKFGLNEVNYNRIEAYHSVNNIASGKVMKNAGMRYEGRMRKKYLSHVGFEDSDLYAILREDLLDTI